jgi:predicted GIY-YIG superfamily endonuclease
MKQQLILFPPRRPLLERFGPEFFRQVPERPGVYLMCGAGDGVLYVGKAKNLRQRLASYRSADLDQLPRKLRRLLCTVERIVWDECADEASALERESELLQAMRPRFNTVGVRPAKPDYVGWRLAGGVLTVGLGGNTADWPERHGPDVQSRWLYGPLLRSLWWALHPEQGWDRMPVELRRARVPTTWSLAASEEADEVRWRVAQFFRGKSPELAEWCLWSAARRPLFERTWAGYDASCLLEFHERLIEVPDGLESLSDAIGEDPAAGGFPASE